MKIRQRARWTALAVLMGSCSLPMLSNADASEWFKFGGRVQIDRDKTEVDGVTIYDDADFRRIWVNFSGKEKDFKYVARFDLDADDIDMDAVVDLAITYSGFGEHLKIQAGRQKTQFGMNWITSASKLSIAERGGVVELHKFARMEGVQLFGKLTDKLNYWVGVFDKSGFEGVAGIGRITYSHMIGENQFFHAGSGLGLSDDRDAINLELAYGNGPFHIQAEIFASDYSDTNKSDANGFYIEAGFILNSALARAYKGGKFGGVAPQGEFGDFQVVARYESGDGNFSDIGLGKTDADVYVLGLNWYMTKQATVMLSYMDGEQNSGGSEGNEWRLRGQYTF